MIIPGQRSLPLSVHSRFVITFTNTVFHIKWLRRFSSPRETPYTDHNRQGLRIPDLRRYPSPGIGHFTLHWSSWFLWILLQFLPWIDIAPLPCFAVFLHCTAVLNCVRATRGFPADRAPVYRGCPCLDPLGCPLFPRQNGFWDKAPTLWLLLCCCNC